MMQDGRINEEILWVPPYDGLKLWTRLWLDTHKLYMRTLAYNKSALMKTIGRLQRKEIQTIRDFVLDQRDKAMTMITKIVENELPEWQEWGRHVPGLGAFSLGKFLGYIGNPAAREYVSCLWRHCGLAPTSDGKLEKPKKGQRRTFNALAKSQLWLIVGNFLKAYPRTPNFYSEYYYTFKERMKHKHPDWNLLHCHLAAVLKVAKLFVSHLWEISRKTQELPTREIYPVEYLGHITKLPAEIALHPVKKREDVERAILLVWDLIESEPDEEVAKTHRELLSKFAEAIEQQD